LASPPVAPIQGHAHGISSLVILLVAMEHRATDAILHPWPGVVQGMSGTTSIPVSMVRRLAELHSQSTAAGSLARRRSDSPCRRRRLAAMRGCPGLRQAGRLAGPAVPAPARG